MAADSLTNYSPVLLPALHRIQDQFGYLKPEALAQFSRESGVPQYRLQEVASFFPHFRLTRSKRVVLRVCRDLSCHLAGSEKILRELDSLNGEQVAIEGVSCLGRCDRAPAACLEVQGCRHQCCYLRSSTDELRAMITASLRAEIPTPGRDVDQSFMGEGTIIDPYKGNSPDYAAVRAALRARDASLNKAMEFLQVHKNWTPGLAETFRVAAVRQMRIGFELEPQVHDAVRCWQMEDDWAKGQEFGGWS